MDSAIPLQHHSYDLLLQHKNPLALRMGDAEHQNIQVGDLVEFSGHDTIMDRERFQVVGKMNHPTLASALNSIEHSHLDIRDKLQMEHSFKEAHGPEAAHGPIVSLQLAPHPTPTNFNRNLGAL